jgi:hypothetical protein
MRHRQQYGLFIHDKEGPLCKAFFPDLEEATSQAQNLADKEGCEYFVFDLVRFVEVAHCYPPQSPERRSPLKWFPIYSLFPGGRGGSNGKRGRERKT